MVALAWLSMMLARLVLVRVARSTVERTQTRWDDGLLQHKFFHRLARLLPALVLYYAAPILFPVNDALQDAAVRLSLIWLVVVGVWLLDSFLKTLDDVYEQNLDHEKRPIKSYLQVVFLVAGLFAAILVVGIALDRSPWKLLTGLGAAMAIILLVFKDTILGFVASIQLSTYDLVRIGDWIEFPKYQADGDVVDITLHTVKVQNWDKTITTIPAYALVSESFKNWRGMSESGGRRIKRALHLDMTSVRFVDAEMLERFKKIRFIQEYLDRKVEEVSKWNQEHEVDEESLVNGRRLTNLGTFRAYVEAYLRNHARIHQDMTFLVRQLPPGESGIPLEIYVFSSEQRWAPYEGIQADIFDHLLAVLPEFGLRVFQSPTGADLRALRPAT